MTRIEKAKYQLSMLRHRPRMFWNKLWVRKDEFHKSLEMDASAMMTMSREDVQKHMDDLVRRRNIAHQRDLERD